MNVTLGESDLLQRALDMLLKVGADGLTAAERNHVYALQRELRDFEKAVRSDDVLEMWTDGSARPTNPGPAGIGVVGKIGGRTVIEVSEHIGRKTNNLAEWMAAVTALRRAIDIGARKVLLHSDSKLVVNQYSGIWQCRDESLQPLLSRARGLAERLESVTIEWIPREENREADGLSVSGAYTKRACGACGHTWHTSFCLSAYSLDDGEPEDGYACGCPYGFSGGLKA